MFYSKSGKRRQFMVAVLAVLLALVFTGLVLAVGETPTDYQTDSDGDRIPDFLDSCPTEGDLYGFGILNNGCAENDSDGDLMPDRYDACPLQGAPDDVAEYLKNDGCLAFDGPLANTDDDFIPNTLDTCDYDYDTAVDTLGVQNNGCQISDRDGDGLANELDTCAYQYGATYLFGMSTAGCEFGDRDNDGVPNVIDVCPDAPGVWETYEGCPDPTAVRLTSLDVHAGSPWAALVAQLKQAAGFR